MRIIAGEHKGRTLESPAWGGLRPTSDRLRETLFNILAPHLGGATVLDGYAGTGAVGLEAISRGAAHVTFVDRDRRATDLVARNLARCRVTDGYVIIRADLGSPATRFPPSSFDLIFLDPPYDVDPAEVMGRVGSWLRPGGLLVLEHARRREAPQAAGVLTQVRRVRSGDSAIAFYTHATPAVAGGEPS